MQWNIDLLNDAVKKWSKLKKRMNKQIIEQDQVKAHSIKQMCFYMERYNEKKKKHATFYSAVREKCQNSEFYLVHYFSD